MPVWFAVPIEIVPAVPVAVPVSILMLPEFEVVPKALPVAIAIAPEFAEAELVAAELRFRALAVPPEETVKVPLPLTACPAAMVSPLLNA
jgi:hypothetical protein